MTTGQRRAADDLRLGVKSGKWHRLVSTSLILTKWLFNQWFTASLFAPSISISCNVALGEPLNPIATFLNLADGPNSLPRHSDVFIPLDIVCRAADHHDIEPAVAIEVDHLASRCGHSHGIEDFVAPLGTRVILRVENMRARDHRAVE